MKNPGSSSPTANPLSDDELSNLNLIDSSDVWFNFTVDPTMKAIVNLFVRRAEARGETFEGVIQIFNIINVMNPNLNEAVRLFRSTDDPLRSTWQADVANIVAPVYVGWGNFHRHPLVADIGPALLSAIREREDIDYQAEAGFTHPLYLMVYGSRKPKSIATKTRFFHH